MAGILFLTSTPLVFADALTAWTKWLAIATFAAVAVAIAGLSWTVRSAASERTAADRRLEAQRKADDERARRQITAAKQAADRQIEAAQQRLEAQKKADDERAERQITAAREAANRQVEEMRAQLDAAERPLLIEVEPTGPIYLPASVSMQIRSSPPSGATSDGSAFLLARARGSH